MRKSKILKVIISLMLVLVLTNNISYASNQESKLITIGISAQSKPYNYYDEIGNLTGFEIELLEEIDKRLDQYNFDYKTTEFASLFAGLDSGTFDLIANNIGEKEERRDKYLFSLYPYVVTHNVIITRPEEGENISLEDLAGKKMGLVAGSSQAIFMEAYNQENPDKMVVLEYIDSDGPTIIREVDNGRIDATIYSTTYLQDVIKTFGIDLVGHLIENEDAIQPPGAYFLYRPDSESNQLRNDIDEVLEQMRNDGFLEDLSIKYFDMDNTKLSEDLINKNNAIETQRLNSFSSDANTKALEDREGRLFVPSLILENIPRILKRLPVTLVLTLVSAVLGLILGFILAIIKIRQVPVLRQLSVVFVSFMRGTPQLVQIFLAFYGLPIFMTWLGGNLGWDINLNSISPYIYLFIAFGLNEAAYTSEIFRSAILSVDESEIEAAKSIGLTNFQTTRRIILPSAMIVAIPNLGNSLISLLKVTSLAFTVTVVDIMAEARIIGAGNLRFFESYIAVALIYWVLCLIIEFMFAFFENKLNVDKKEVKPSAKSK